MSVGGDSPIQQVAEITTRLNEWCWHNDYKGVEVRATTDVRALIIDHVRLRARVQELEAERNHQHQLKEQALDELARIRMTPTTWDDGHAAGYRSAAHNYEAQVQALDSALPRP